MSDITKRPRAPPAPAPAARSAPADQPDRRRRRGRRTPGVGRQELLENARWTPAPARCASCWKKAASSASITDDGCGFRRTSWRARCAMRPADPLRGSRRSRRSVPRRLLASIASVAEMSITSRTADAALSMKIDAAVRHSPAGRTGTTIEVRELYFNTPARQVPEERADRVRPAGNDSHPRRTSRSRCCTTARRSSTGMRPSRRSASRDRRRRGRRTPGVGRQGAARKRDGRRRQHAAHRAGRRRRQAHLDHRRRLRDCRTRSR